jgi:hypothetical protein
MQSTLIHRLFQRFKQWFNNHSQKTRKISGRAKDVPGGQSKPHNSILNLKQKQNRKPTKVQTYSIHFYESRCKETIISKWAAENPQKAIPVSFITREVAAMYEKEDLEIIAQVQALMEQAKQPVDAEVLKELDDVEQKGIKNLILLQE